MLRAWGEILLQLNHVEHHWQVVSIVFINEAIVILVFDFDQFFELVFAKRQGLLSKGKANRLLLQFPISRHTLFVLGNGLVEEFLQVGWGELNKLHYLLLVHYPHYGFSMAHDELKQLR